MKIRSKNSLIAGVVLLVVFVLFTLEIKMIGVEAVGPEGSSVGLASLNSFAAKIIGVREFWYEVTQALGYVSLLIMAVFAFAGAYQLIKSRSIAAVDKKILLLGAFYVVLLAVYLFFEFASVNYRPILIEGELDPSYPSSHTVLASCVFGSLALISDDLPVFGEEHRPITRIVCWLLAGVSVVGRLLSGYHWFTDILGGVLLSACLLCFFEAARRELSDERDEDYYDFYDDEEDEYCEY